MIKLALLRRFRDWLRSLFFFEEDEYPPTLAPVAHEIGKEASLPQESAPEAALPADAQHEALAFLERIQDKLHKLAADFNAGAINPAQFRDLYAHYQLHRPAGHRHC